MKIVPNEYDRELFKRVIENRDKIDSCPKHDFGAVNLPLSFGVQFTCRHCQGHMKAVDAFRYIQGFEAAGGNPNEVLQGYRPDWKDPTAAQGLSDAPTELLTEHSGCGSGIQVDQLTVRLHPGDKVVLVMGPYSAAISATRATKPTEAP